MTDFKVSASAYVPAPQNEVYAIIADYRNGHPRILPPRYFTDLVVESGGVGAGTVIDFGMRAMGSTRRMRATISEPEPGRLLVESGIDQGIVTTFTVDRERDGSRVEIATTMPIRAGLLGAFERWFSKRFLLRVYRDELALLSTVASNAATRR